jgi:hypothetical protein
VHQKPDPLHGVHAQFFSNAFSNASDFGRLRPAAYELKAQYSRRLWSPADVSEVKRAAWHARGWKATAPKMCGFLSIKTRESSGPLSIGHETDKGQHGSLKTNDMRDQTDSQLPSASFF